MEGLVTAGEPAELVHPALDGVSREELKKWYALMHLARILDDKAPNYLKQGLGWSYHAPSAGHDGIQVALGTTFRPGRDYLFPYYRDLTTCVAAGISVEEILLNGMSKAADVASGGRHQHEDPPRRRQGPLRLRARDARGGDVREGRVGDRPRSRRLHPHPLALQLRPARALPLARGARGREGG